MGIVDVKADKVSKKVWDAMASWIARDNIAMLTGNLGNCHHNAAAVAELGRRTGAISWCPSFQPLKCHNDESWLHPSYYLLYGFHTAIIVPEGGPPVDRKFRLGNDIWDEMLRLEDMPEWQALVA